MKIKNILLLFLWTNLSFAQQPPPFFKIEYNKLSPTKNSIIEDYIFNTSKTTYIFKTDEKYLYIYTSLAEKGEIIQLKIKNKLNNKIMNIYVKTSQDIGWGDFIEINNLNFVKGDFFFNLNDSTTKSQSIESQNYHNVGILEISTLKKHKISKRKLKKLFNEIK
jgi:hypothetical protein